MRTYVFNIDGGNLGKTEIIERVDGEPGEPRITKRADGEPVVTGESGVTGEPGVTRNPKIIKREIVWYIQKPHPFPGCIVYVYVL